MDPLRQMLRLTRPLRSNLTPQNTPTRSVGTVTYLRTLPSSRLCPEIRQRRIPRTGRKRVMLPSILKTHLQLL